MKKINTQASETLNKMIGMMDGGFIKMDNSQGVFMALSVEQLYEYDKFKIFSLTQHYENQGIQMCDSEMRFILNKNTGNFFPCFYKDNIGLEQTSIRMDCGNIKSVRIIQQLEHSVVGNQFLEKIKFQQNL